MIHHEGRRSAFTPGRIPLPAKSIIFPKKLALLTRPHCPILGAHGAKHSHMSRAEFLTNSGKRLLLVDGGDFTAVPDIAQVSFLSALGQKAGSEHGRTFAASIAHAFIKNAI